MSLDNFTAAAAAPLDMTDTAANEDSPPLKDLSVSISEKQVLFAVLALKISDYSGCALTSIRLKDIEKFLAKHIDGTTTSHTFAKANQSGAALLEMLFEKGFIVKEPCITSDDPIYALSKKGAEALGWKFTVQPDLNRMAQIAESLSI